MKKITILVFVVVILALGYFIFFGRNGSSSKSAYGPSDSGSLECTVAADNGTVDGSSFWNSSDTSLVAAMNCGLDQLMMNNFLYLVGNDSGIGKPRFMMYAPWYVMFPDSGTPSWSGDYYGLVNSRLAVPDNQQQAGDGYELLDVNNAVTSYDLRVNKTFFDYVVENKLYTQDGLGVKYQSYVADDKTGGIWLPPRSVADSRQGAVEIKTAWRDYGPATKGACPGDIMHCETDDTGNSWGLVGMHLVQKTVHQGSFIWATFEHIGNVPDCRPGYSNPIAQNPSLNGESINVNKNISGLSAQTGWNYFNYSTYTSQGGDGQYCGYPGLLGSNQLCLKMPQTSTGWQQVNVCRTQPLKTADDSSCAEARTDATNLLTTSCLNKSVQENFPSSLLSKWKYYQMVGMEWIMDGATNNTGGPLTGCFHYDGSPKCTYTPPDVSFTRKGNVNLANATMETWMQLGVITTDKNGNTYKALDCVSCHQPPTASYDGSVYQGDMSHIFGRVTRKK